MRVIKALTVNEAYTSAMHQLSLYGVRQSSRAGDVIAFQEPVSIVTMFPNYRVLIDPKRDANPFFHVAEALWMLAGRSDARFLDKYVRTFSERFADDGDQHGAYGRRWRSWFGFDQLNWAVERLQKNPDDRRVVLTMFDPTRDTSDALRDVPCNLIVMLRVVTRAGHPELDVTICQRSGDLIWGTCGANAVHMSFLQEYLAARIGAEIGEMTQVVNNLHAYTAVYDKMWPPAGHIYPRYESIVRLVDQPSTFDASVKIVLDCIENDWLYDWKPVGQTFLDEVAAPMMLAHSEFRRGDHTSAQNTAARIADEAWRRAALEWLSRRMPAASSAITSSVL